MTPGVNAVRDADVPADNDERTLAKADLELSELLEVMEAVDWSAVPGISTAEAAAWVARIDEARDAVREQAPDGRER